MGTYYLVKFWSNDSLSQEELKAIHQEIEQELTEVNLSMSTYIDNSELSLLNKNNAFDWQTVTPSLYQVLSAALDIYSQCDGAFDVTVGPLVNLWGFGPEQRPEKVPTEQEIDLAKLRVGSDKLKLQNKENTYQVRRADNVYIDLSALAKGHGVDRLAIILEKRGMNGYLVDIGGEIKLKGSKPDQSLWQIAVVSPDSLLDNTVYKAFSITDIAMATSGDYRNYFEENGVRYSHTINPKTAKPIRHKLASVSVLHDSSMYSDALATCLLVKGDRAGFEWAQENKIAAYFIVKNDDGFSAKMTDEFKRLTEVN